VAIPEGVTYIGLGAFQECWSLVRVNIPDNVMFIDHLAFRGCTGLTTVTIGTGLVSFGDLAFFGCLGLQSMYFKGSPPHYGQECFTGAPDVVFYYRAGSSGWGDSYAGRPTALWVPPPRLHGPLEPDGAGFHFLLQAELGQAVRLQWSRDLATWADWREATGTGTAQQVVDENSVLEPIRFYRAILP
jgi:hypothetical protein